MLHEFITENRERIISACRDKISSRPEPRATDAEIEHGVPFFLDQLVETLRLRMNGNPAIEAGAVAHGSELLESGFTIGQVVHDYGGICQAITQLAIDDSKPISTEEFHLLNRSLDDAIACAVGEYSRLTRQQGTERLAMVEHEMRNLLNTASLAFGILKAGIVGMSGSTAGVLDRSLMGLRAIIDTELAVVRLDTGLQNRTRVDVRAFIAEAEVAATMEATSRSMRLAVISVAPEIWVHVDRQILGSVVANLLHNAFKFSRPNGRVVLRAHANADRAVIEVEDQCGGLPPGDANEMFRPFQQRSADRTGLGLGLTVCYRGVEACGGALRVMDRPGVGCVFTVDLPRHVGGIEIEPA